MQFARLALLPVTFSVLSLSACGPHLDKVAPAPPTADQIIGYNEAPLIIDWPAPKRGDLELAMRNGVAVVAYDKQGIRLLPDCRLDGDYGFARFKSTKEEVVGFTSGDALRANLPLGGAGLAVKLDAELTRGASLDVALVMIGKRATTWSTAKAEELVAANPDGCKEATHFVRGAFVGAFAMQLGSKAHAATTAEIFAGKAGWESDVSRTVRQMDGSLDACRTSAGDNTDNCGALLHIELVKLAAAASRARASDVPTEGGACPQGYVRAGAGCVRAGSARAHQCKYGDWDDCTKQCDAGSAESCGSLSTMYYKDRKGKRDVDRAAALAAKSCGGGSAYGCYRQGLTYYRGLGGPQDFAKAAEYERRACDGAVGMGCSILAMQYEHGFGVEKNLDQALKLHTRGCDLGDATACNNLGAYFNNLTPPDPKKAAPALKRSCDGDEQVACANLAGMMLNGDLPKDPTKAEAMLISSCKEGYGSSCRTLAMHYASGEGLPKNPEGAAAAYKDAVRELTYACEQHDGDDCSTLGYMYGNGEGIPKDAAQAAAYFEKACNAGDYPDGCSDLGKLYLYGWYGSEKDLPRARAALEKGCTAGSRNACYQLGMTLRDNEPLDEARGVALLDKACTLGEGEACRSLGQSYERGEAGLTRDYAKAKSYYDRGCDELKSGTSCALVGIAYEEGRGVPAKDPAKANEYYDRSCKYGYLRGCYFLAMNLQDGLGVTADVPRAVTLYTKACEGDELDACDRLAKLYAAGKAGSPQQALALFKKNCDAGRAPACNSVGTLFEEGGESVAKDELQAALYYRKACDGKSGAGCKNLADLYANGRGVGKDETKALEFYSLACTLGATNGCTQAAKRRMTPKMEKPELQRVYAMLDRGCDGHDGEACDLLGAMSEQGRPPVVARSLETAYQYYGEACVFRWASGCFHAGSMVERGLGTTRDARRAVMLYARACAMGDANGCSSAAMIYFRGGSDVDRNPELAKMLFRRACDGGDKRSCAFAK